MTKEDAWRIIQECRNWNTMQTSVALAFDGVRTDEDDMLDARRVALAQAWKTVATATTPQE